MLISDATAKNWERLHPDLSRRLKSRANKTRSGKRFCPGESILNRKTRSFLAQVRFICDEEKLPVEIAVWSLGLKMLEKHGIANRKNVRESLQHHPETVCERLSGLILPEGETDLLGIVYQSLLTEGEKNVLGSYYTPSGAAVRMLGNTNLGNRSFLDPCCGSGIFLLAISTENPEQLWGCDCDPVAVMIAKINLLCRYASSDFVPNIFCCNYLEGGKQELFHRKFDLIATNPPWGAKKGKEKSNDSSARFFFKAYSQLREKGKILFLFPESILNVRSHRKIRRMLLTETRLNSVTFPDEKFTGVMTGYAFIDADKGSPVRTFSLRKEGCTLIVNTDDILARKDAAIVFSEDRYGILKTMDSAGRYDLSAGIFALGIVTGNNRKLVQKTPLPGTEPVFMGKDTDRFTMRKPGNYILYRRKNFQQAAKEEYYRAPEKLIYRFIAGEPVFAYDDTRTLCLNSANILIPSVPGYGIRTVLAFLNSYAVRYYYRQSFHGIKVLKSSLLQLPFPRITAETDTAIQAIVDRILQGNGTAEEELQEFICRCYGLNETQTAFLRQQFAGK